MKTQIKSKGFSLIEMTIAVVIMAVVASLAYPQFRVWIENSRIRNTAESLLTGLQLARAEAVARNANVQLVIEEDTVNWSVGCVNIVGDEDGDGADDCPAVIQSRSGNEDNSSKVVITAALESPYVFNSLGRITPAPDAPPISIDVDMDTSVLTAAESRDLRINIGVGGDIKMCDPSVEDEEDLRKCPE